MGKYILIFGTDRPLGSLGGSTFQRCGKVFAIRKRNVPVQKRSPRQSAVKNKFDHVQKEWKNLTSGNQTQWEDETTNYARTNSLGDPYFISGSNLQASSNINLLNSAEPEIPQPVAFSPIAPPVYGGEATSFNSQIISIFSAPQIIPAGVSMQFWMSRPVVAPPENLTLDQMKLIKTWQAGEDSAGNIYSEYVQAWSDILPAIQSVWLIAFRYIINDTGQFTVTTFSTVVIVP
jgi:hypothetical protein